MLEPDAPYALAVEVTSHCQLTCRMCPLTTGRTLSSRQPGPMREVLWQEVVKIARGVRQVIIGGFGDPLANPRFVSFLEALDRHAVVTSFSTNGVALTPRIAHQLATFRYLQHVNVSIDAPDAATYRAIRGGDLRRALAGASNLAAALHDPSLITVSSVLMRGNVARLEAFPGLLRSLGVRRYFVQGFLDLNPELAAESLVEHDGAGGELARLREACATAGVELIVNMPERVALDVDDRAAARSAYYRQQGPPGASKQCVVPWDIPFVDKDGRVFPCCYAAGDGGPVLGTLGRQSWESVWHGQRYRAFRRRLLAGRPPAICRRCTAVPWGEHPLNAFAAQIVLDRSRLRTARAARVVVRNTGTRVWTRSDNVRLGTALPRNAASAFAHPSWLHANRIGTFTEPTVAPGEHATFEFVLARGVTSSSEVFQVVVDGVCWVPNTRFTIERRPSARAGVRHSGRWIRDRVVSLLRAAMAKSRPASIEDRAAAPDASVTPP